MSITTELAPQFWAFWVLSAFSVICGAVDLWRGRIYNWLTIPMMLAGFAHSAVSGGWWAFGLSVLAAILALLAYGWMFWLGHMGAGDVKFLMAVGAWGGVGLMLEVALLAIFVGAALGVLILLVQGRLFPFVGRLFRFLQSIFIRELVVAFPKVDRAYTMPYGIPLAVAAIWSAWAHPMGRFLVANFGGRPWF